MNPTSAREAKATLQAIKKVTTRLKRVQTVICPPAIYLRELKSVASAACALGGQTCHFENEGAFTGEISPKMLTDVGASYVIIGHSERRAMGETNADINRKLKAAIKARLIPVLCVGETERDEHGNYLSVVNAQIEEALMGIPKGPLASLIVAYEPVWAIGAAATGADTPEAFRHNAIFVKKVIATLKGKDAADTVPVLYGGSVNAKNAESFLVDGQADGLLVGRESLRPKGFEKILLLANELN